MIAAPGEFLVLFVLATLATWRITHFLAAEDGPGNLIFYLRRSLGQGWLASLADCFNCLSLVIAAPAALFVTRGPLLWAAVWLALSGAACLLERSGHQLPLVDPFAQALEGDADVLRRETLDDPTPAPAPDPHGGPPERAVV